MKYCNGCKQAKPFDDFGKESRSKNGYKPRCKKYLNQYYKSLYPKFKNGKIKSVCKYRKENAHRIKPYKQNPAIKKEVNRLWREKNRSIINNKANEYEKSRVKNDPEYRLIKNMRKLIYRLGIEKGNRTEIVLGYSHKELIIKLGKCPSNNESIDHKIPVTWFIKGCDVKVINHLDNLQILSRSENSKKNNSFSHPISKEYFNIAIQFIKPNYINKLKTI